MIRDIIPAVFGGIVVFVGILVCALIVGTA